MLVLIRGRWARSCRALMNIQVGKREPIEANGKIIMKTIAKNPKSKMSILSI